MSVVLTIYDCGSLTLKLQFFYLPKLELVTVKAEDAAQQEILGSVFPNDFGVDVPYEAANQILAEQSLEFGAERLDRPYLWVSSYTLTNVADISNICLVIQEAMSLYFNKDSNRHLIDMRDHVMPFYRMLLQWRARLKLPQRKNCHVFLMTRQEILLSNVKSMLAGMAIMLQAFKQLHHVIEWHWNYLSHAFLVRDWLRMKRTLRL